MKLGILTCAKQPDLYLSDQPLIEFFANHGIEAEPVIWNERKTIWDQYNALLIRSIWDYYYDNKTFTDWLNLIELKQIPVLNSLETVRKNYHKSYLMYLSDRGIDTIPTKIFGKTKSLNLSEILDFQWEKMVIKPAISAGSHLTRLFHFKELKDVENEYKAIAAQTDLLVQPFMTEIQSEGEISLIFFEDEFQYAVVKKPKGGDFRVQLQFGGQYKIYHPTEAILKTAKNIISNFGGNLLYSRVDGIISDGIFLLMELELIEPDLYFNIFPEGLERFGKATLKRLENI